MSLSFVGPAKAMAVSSTFVSGMALSLSLIMAIGPQNAHVLRMGLQRRHLWLTVAVCTLADVLLIALGVLGLGRAGGLSDKLQGAMVGAGVLFLLLYGWQAWQRCRRAVGTALALSWLNPHAWLDTAVLIGSASLAYGTPGNHVFGAGAAVGSLLWFVLLGAVALWSGRRLRSAQVWRVMDGVVALMMWGTAVWLVQGLL